MATPTTIKGREEYAATRSPQDYVSPEVWDREVTLLMRDYPFDRVMAERLFGQAVSYLITSMEKWGQGLELGRGPIVDIAVHVCILDTANYREFCAEHFAGGVLEHIPAIEFKCDGSVERTWPQVERSLRGAQDLRAGPLPTVDCGQGIVILLRLFTQGAAFAVELLPLAAQVQRCRSLRFSDQCLVEEVKDLGGIGGGGNVGEEAFGLRQADQGDAVGVHDLLVSQGIVAFSLGGTLGALRFAEVAAPQGLLGACGAKEVRQGVLEGLGHAGLGLAVEERCLVGDLVLVWKQSRAAWAMETSKGLRAAPVAGSKWKSSIPRRALSSLRRAATLELWTSS
ncbi:hypothetical protein ABT040_33645 [Streptomyces sp. NPDC002688]|uniref:hypothetical protein n=1 Tax=Streptomyces sp. NPDC002688 TaxID=3154423 RepID=UPI003330FE4B